MDASVVTDVVARELLQGMKISDPRPDDATTQVRRDNDIGVGIEAAAKNDQSEALSMELVDMAGEVLR